MAEGNQDRRGTGPDPREDSEVEIITPPNTLQEKVRLVDSGGVDAKVLERAEQIVASLQSSYLDWVGEDLAKLQAAYDALAAEPAKRKDNLRALFGVTHDIKGQGGSFGYGLMTQFGTQLCRFIEKIENEGIEKLEERHLEVMRLHVEALKLVIAKRLEGEGGAMGANLAKGLDMVLKKVTVR